MIPIAIIGAAGRMGTRIAALAREEKPPRFEVVAEVTRSNRELSDATVAIDFSSLESTRAWLPICSRRNIAMLIGTTGLTNEDHAAIDEAARVIPILQTTNTSLGVAVLNKLVADAALMLANDLDIEIVEAHHRFKKDAPSGTAISLADSINRAMPQQKVTTSSIRIGDEVGTHTVHLASLGERLELTHRATSRDTFARGALRAAGWLATQKPWRYRMADVLGI